MKSFTNSSFVKEVFPFKSSSLKVSKMDFEGIFTFLPCIEELMAAVISPCFSRVAFFQNSLWVSR
ncbi:hypothetical protein HanXRQr2_Chr10g0450051 [Helianthus annuus]|uniref:Uncharacterized protein n=1 Tax=Helianthus annuus TaxID=4232 RepID=A0A9K3HZ80_HELAN|nr:hypothetical protein HanXRQr2_Chr10g0450051 [Helianthus annuus]